MELLNYFEVIKLIALMIVVPLSIAWPLTRKTLPLGTAWFIGAGLKFYLVFLFYALGANKELTYGFIFLLSGIGLVWSLTKEINSFTMQSFKRFPWQDCLFILLALPTLWVAFSNTILTTVEAGDALAGWFPKAKHFASWRPLIDIKTPAYPNFAAEYWGMIISYGPGDEAFGRLFFPLVAFMGVFSLVQISIKSIPRKSVLASLSLILIGAFFLRYFLESRFAANSFLFFGSGYNDCLIPGIFLAAIGCYAKVFELLENSNNLNHKGWIWFLSAMTITSMLGHIKLEGIVYCLGTLTLFLIFFLASKGRPYLNKQNTLVLLSIVFTFLIALSNKILFHFIYNVDIKMNTGHSLSNLLHIFDNITRIQEILKFYGMVAGAILPIIAVSIIIIILSFLLIPQKRIFTSYLALLFAGMFIFSGTPQYFVTGIDYKWLLVTTFDRLFFHHSFLYAAIPLLLYPHFLNRLLNLKKS